MQQEEQVSSDEPREEQSLGKPEPRAPMPPWSLVITRPLGDVDKMIRHWFDIQIPERTRRGMYQDGTVRYVAMEWPDQTQIACVLFIRPYGDDAILSVDDVPEALEAYNDLMAHLPAFLEHEYRLPPISIDAPPVPEPPPYDWDATRARLATALEQVVAEQVAKVRLTDQVQDRQIPVDERAAVKLYNETYKREKQQGHVKNTDEWLRRHDIHTSDRNFRIWRKKFSD